MSSHEYNLGLSINNEVIGLSLQERIANIIDSVGYFGVAARDLTQGRELFINADKTFNTASVIKVPIMIELFRRVYEDNVSLDDRLILEDKFRTGGSGILKEFRSGLQLTLWDLCVAMIALSDNVATNMLIDYLGIDAINRCMDSLGAYNTRLHRMVGFKSIKPDQPKGLGRTTPREMMMIFQKLAEGDVISESASEEMIAILAKQHDRNMIPRLLPIDYDSVSGDYDSAIVANKTGAVDGVRNDVALIRFANGKQWVICILTKDLRDLSWKVDHEGEIAIAKIALEIYKEWI